MADEGVVEAVAVGGFGAASTEPAHLATFPEQNPNPVIETDLHGRVTYLNPEAVARFPELSAQGIDHPLVAGVLETVAQFRDEGREFAQREVEFGEAVFEQKVCYSPNSDIDVIRIYTHDVTAHRLAESALAGVARRIVVAQEQERKRVSRGLHDEAGQAMAALKISLQLLKQEPGFDDEVFGDSLDAAIDLLDETWEQIRLVARDLRPPALDALGLSDTLDDFCTQFSARTQLRIIYKGHANADLDDAYQITIYRLLQEALANVAMHANATGALVTLKYRDGHVQLTVRDDGSGMDPEILNDTKRRGLGVVGMRERIETLGGLFTIESGPHGTAVIATLPLEDV